MVWPPHINHGMSSMTRLIAVAIDRDKGSQISLKWTVENLVAKGQTLILIHVKAKQSSPFLAISASLPLPRSNQISDMDDNGSTNGESAAQTKELFLPFHVYCARKDISCYDVLLEDTDVTKAITEFVKQSGIDVLVLGATAKGNIFRSPFTHRMGPNGKPYDLSPQDTDISFVSSGRKSIDMFPSYCESFESGHTPSQLSGLSDIENHAFESWQLGRKSVGTIPLEFSYASLEDYRTSTSQSMEEIEAEMRRLKLELKQTMDMYSTACKEALSARQKAKELQHWKMEEQRRLEEARLAEEAALALVEKEKAKSRAALEHAEAAQRIAELEAQKRINAERKVMRTSNFN